MRGFTHSRLERLESRQSSPCPECGAGGPVTCEVIWADDDPGEEEEEFCRLCGKQTMLTVTWGDEAHLREVSPPPPGGWG